MNMKSVTSAVIALFDKARAAGLKFPKIRLQTPEGVPVVLHQAGAQSQYNGQVMVTDGGRFGSNRYFGRVDLDRRLVDGRDMREDVCALLIGLAANPEKVASARPRQRSAWTRKLLLGVTTLAAVLVGQAGAVQPNFPPFPGDQNGCYQYISSNISTPPGIYGTDLRSHYDELTASGIIATLLDALARLSPPATCIAANWQPVVEQIGTELSYVQTANDWILGPTGSQTLVTQIFIDTGFDVDSVSEKLQNVDPSDTVAADLTRLFTGVAIAIGGAVTGGIGPAMSNIFNQVSNYMSQHGGFPDPNMAVAAVDGALANMYNTALDGNNDTHEQLVTNWSQLQAFAEPKVGTAPTDDDQTAMRRAGEIGYAIWLWQTLTPTRWHIVVPLTATPNFGCYFTMVGGYPNPAIQYPVNSNYDCGPAWIGDACGSTQCDPPSKEAFDFLFTQCPGQTDCRDPVNGPLAINPADVFLSNGWSLPCVGSCPWY